MSTRRSMSRDEVRAFDQRAIEQFGLSGLILMENAGRQAADIATEMMRQSRGNRPVILAGPGNNGGDGFVIARHLVTRGLQAQVLLLADPHRLKGDALANFKPLSSIGVEVLDLHDAPLPHLRRQIEESAARATILIDAMLGTGIAEEVRDPFRSAIAAVNGCNIPVLAVDLPSGLDADSGQPLGEAIRASVTVTMVAPKTGFDSPGAADYLGQVVVADIGLPADLS